MNKIPENELLSLLGFDDPPHSLKWYRDRYPDTPNILRDFIKISLNTEKGFPQGISKLDSRNKCHRYPYTIEKIYGLFVVKRNNTDRGEVWKYKIFINIDKAITYLIENSFTAAGSIRDYWDIV